MGDGFLDAYDTPAPFKDLMSFDSRVMNGVRYSGTRYKDKRELTLNFVITAADLQQLRARRDAFLAELSANTASVFDVPGYGAKSLVFTGKNLTYAASLDRTAAKLSAKFIEHNSDEQL